MCARQWSFKRWPTFLPAATQTFLTDIQSGKFEPKQDGLLLVPPCLLDWSAPICEAVWVAHCKMMGSLSDKGEWGVNCYSAERNHQTSSCRSWRAMSRALQKPSDRAARGCSPPASGKYTELKPSCFCSANWNFVSVRAEKIIYNLTNIHWGF